MSAGMILIEMCRLCPLLMQSDSLNGIQIRDPLWYATRATVGALDKIASKDIRAPSTNLNRWNDSDFQLIVVGTCSMRIECALATNPIILLQQAGME